MDMYPDPEIKPTQAQPAAAFERESSVPLEAVLCTGELNRRAARAPDYRAENHALVALSANAIPRDMERGLQAGFFRYLTKPIKVGELLETLDVALEFAQKEAGQGR